MDAHLSDSQSSEISSTIATIIQNESHLNAISNTQTAEISNSKQQSFAFVSLVDENNFEFSMFIGVVFIFLICLCIIGFCVVKEKRKFKAIDEKKERAKRDRFLFNNDHSKSMYLHRPHHVISVSPQTSITFNDHNLISPQSIIERPVSPITPIVCESTHHLIHKQYAERQFDGKHEGDVTQMIQTLIDEEEDEEDAECKAHVLEDGITHGDAVSITYDELMRNNDDGSSDETHCSQLADDEFVIKDDENTETQVQKEVSIVIDDDMISLMSMSEGAGKFCMLKPIRQSNAFPAIQEMEDDDDPNLF